jgi:hypothetical protein
MISVSIMSVSLALPRPHKAEIGWKAEMVDLRRVGGTISAMGWGSSGKAVTKTVAAIREENIVIVANPGGGQRPPRLRKTKIFMRHKRGFPPSDKYGHCNHY